MEVFVDLAEDFRAQYAVVGFHLVDDFIYGMKVTCNQIEQADSFLEYLLYLEVP